MKRIRRAPNIAITPPNLFGIDRRIAYSHRKYHSGWICRGVTRGFAGMKFSGSPSRFGANKARKVKRRRRITNPTVSFVV
jgi:hypothetical protein